MYSKFLYKSLQLKDIALDDRNPRIVSQTPITSQADILVYLFEHEDLLSFIKKIAKDGKNYGAERPYVVEDTPGKYTVVEGNTRIATYKVLTGLLKAPKLYQADIPSISAALQKELLTVDCTISPNRDLLLPIMANSHFGTGDKSKWGYLGSRKAVYDEWNRGKTVQELAKTFVRTTGEIKDYLLEYMLYLEALSGRWTKNEKEILLIPSVEFNPPVRFLQSQGHKAKVGISYDKANLKIIFESDEAKEKFYHMVKKLVINPQTGIGATASYDQVFVDYKPKTVKNDNDDTKSDKKREENPEKDIEIDKPEEKTKKAAKKTKKIPKNVLFTYQTTVNDAVLRQLMNEAKSLDCVAFPGASTFLLRNILEALLKHIIHEQNANKAGKALSLEECINICIGNAVTLDASDVRLLKEFKVSHLNSVNLGAHGNMVPNAARVTAARDCIDQLIKRNI